MERALRGRTSREREQNLLEAEGLILVAPTSRLHAWDHRTHRRVPTYIHVGDHDLGLPAALDHERPLKRAGVPVHLKRRPNLGHQLPDDLDVVISAALAWIREDPS